MTRRRGDPFNSGNHGIPPPGLKGPKGKKFGHKAKGTGQRVAAPLLEQRLQNPLVLCLAGSAATRLTPVACTSTW